MDFAGVLPLTHLPLLVNEVEEIGAVKLTKWWKEPLVSKLEYLQRTVVTKCGISSRATTGRVVYVTAAYFLVEGNEVTPFSVPGDSGSLVLNSDGEILGVVTEIAQFEQHGTTYITQVVPVWQFHLWLCELSEFSV